MATKLTKDYAQALWIAAEFEHADAKKLVRNLSAHLGKEGRLKLLPGILWEFKRLEAAKEKLNPQVEVSHEREARAALKEASSYGLMVEKARVNPSLVKGWRATGNGKLLDASAKRELVELYRRIIAR